MEYTHRETHTPISLSSPWDSGWVVKYGYHRPASSQLPPFHPCVPSESARSKQQREKIDSTFPGSCLMVRFSKWKLGIPSHHIYKMLVCFIALWGHEKACRKETVQSFCARNQANKYLWKYKEGRISVLHSLVIFSGVPLSHHFLTAFCTLRDFCISPPLTTSALPCFQGLPHIACFLLFSSK